MRIRRKINTIFQFLMAGLFTTLVSGCATMYSKSIYSIPIKTKPSEATIKVIDKKGNRTIASKSPDTLVLKASSGYFKRAEYLIQVSSDGYQSEDLTFYFTMNKKYLYNILTTFFMPIGFLLVDPISGAMWKPEKQEVEIILKPNQ